MSTKLPSLWCEVSISSLCTSHGAHEFLVWQSFIRCLHFMNMNILCMCVCSSCNAFTSQQCGACCSRVPSNIARTKYSNSNWAEVAYICWNASAEISGGMVQWRAHHTFRVCCPRTLFDKVNGNMTVVMVGASMQWHAAVSFVMLRGGTQQCWLAQNTSEYKHKIAYPITTVLR